MNPKSMQAIVVRETGKTGDWNELSFEEAPRPGIEENEVLVKVEACSVNRADLLQRRGLYPPPPGASSILGLDFSGSVVEKGPRVKALGLHDRVFGITAGGGYGRYAAVPEDHLARIPDRMSFIEAAAAAEVFFTAFLNVFLEADIQPGESLLIHGGGSGVGTAAIQLARESGVSVIITAGSSDKIRRCLDLGASHGINYNETDFAPEVLKVTGNRGVDVILDWIGASYLGKHLKILKPRGRLVLIGLMGGTKAEIQLPLVLSKRLRIIGSVLRSRSFAEKAELTRAFRERVLPLLESGRVRAIVDRVYSIRAAEEAHQYMREGNHFGKIVLSWEGLSE